MDFLQEIKLSKQDIESLIIWSQFCNRKVIINEDYIIFGDKKILIKDKDIFEILNIIQAFDSKLMREYKNFIIGIIKLFGLVEKNDFEKYGLTQVLKKFECIYDYLGLQNFEFDKQIFEKYILGDKWEKYSKNLDNIEYTKKLLKKFLRKFGQPKFGNEIKEKIGLTLAMPKNIIFGVIQSSNCIEILHTLENRDGKTIYDIIDIEHFQNCIKTSQNKEKVILNLIEQVSIFFLNFPKETMNSFGEKILEKNGMNCTGASLLAGEFLKYHFGIHIEHVLDSKNHTSCFRKGEKKYIIDFTPQHYIGRIQQLPNFIGDEIGYGYEVAKITNFEKGILVQSYVWIGKSLLKTGNIKTALYFFQASLELIKNKHGYIGICECYYILNDIEKLNKYAKFLQQEYNIEFKPNM